MLLKFRRREVRLAGGTSSSGSVPISGGGAENVINSRWPGEDDAVSCGRGGCHAGKIPLRHALQWRFEQKSQTRKAESLSKWLRPRVGCRKQSATGKAREFRLSQGRMQSGIRRNKQAARKQAAGMAAGGRKRARSSCLAQREGRRCVMRDA